MFVRNSSPLCFLVHILLSHQQPLTQRLPTHFLLSRDTSYSYPRHHLPASVGNYRSDWWGWESTPLHIHLHFMLQWRRWYIMWLAYVQVRVFLFTSLLLYHLCHHYTRMDYRWRFLVQNINYYEHSVLSVCLFSWYSLCVIVRSTLTPFVFLVRSEHPNACWREMMIK